MSLDGVLIEPLHGSVELGLLDAGPTYNEGVDRRGIVINGTGEDVGDVGETATNLAGELDAPFTRRG